MSTAVLRYPRETLWADYVRAGAGALLCGLPLVLIEVNRWIGVMLGAGFALFALFFLRPAMRQMTRFVMAADTLAADGPLGGLVEWARLDLLKLAYYATKRDRGGG